MAHMTIEGNLHDEANNQDKLSNDSESQDEIVSQGNPSKKGKCGIKNKASDIGLSEEDTSTFRSDLRKVIFWHYIRINTGQFRPHFRYTNLSFPSSIFQLFTHKVHNFSQKLSSFINISYLYFIHSIETTQTLYHLGFFSTPCGWASPVRSISHS